MYTIEDIIASLHNETRVINHLFTKIPSVSGAFDYKPSAYQRSMKELLTYMSTMGIMLTKIFKANGYVPQDHQQAELAMEEFPARMEEQMDVVAEYLRSLTSQELESEIDPFKSGAMSLKLYILNVLLKTYTAYRMQLFLYIKGSGTTAIGTSNLRWGYDAA